MSKILCAWADLAEDADAAAWYAGTHVPDVATKLNSRACNATEADDIFKEVQGIDGEYLTLYDLPADVEVAKVDAQMQGACDKLPKNAKIDARIYEEWELWHGEQWRGHASDIQLSIIVLWQPLDAVHDDFVKWFRTDFVPGMLESSEVLRSRIFRLNHASVVRPGALETTDTSKMYQYMTIWEFDCEELPWEVMVYLGGSEMWRYYVEGGLLSWQIAQYLVDRFHPESDEEDFHSESELSEEEDLESDVRDLHLKSEKELDPKSE